MLKESEAQGERAREGKERKNERAVRMHRSCISWRNRGKKGEEVSRLRGIEMTECIIMFFHIVTRAHPE